MTPLYDTQEFYKKMSQLQERLRKSEDERMKLEERFNLLSEDFRSRRETCINNLRMRYIDFLEEQRLRDERNQQILGALDKIDGSLARMTARTDRLGILRKQYEAYLLRVYANRNTEGGTADSGVGSHNEDRSPKSIIPPIQKNLPQTQQRRVTRNVGNPQSFIPQTKYPRSYLGSSDISQFDIPRYTSRQKTPEVHAIPAQGIRNSSAILQSQRIPQLFHDSENRDVPNTSVSKTQFMPNVSQEFISPNRNYPQQFSSEQLLRSNNQPASIYAQVQHHPAYEIPKQYLANPKLPYSTDPSMTRSQKLSDSQGMISSELQSLSGLQPDTSNRRAMANFSTGLDDEAFNPYRESTPLPGYLDYLTRYPRDPSVHDPNLALRYGLMKSNLEKVNDMKEHILPTDYLHNSETVGPTIDASKLSSLSEDKQRVPNAKPSRALNDDRLDQYINRIRSLHRDNDQSLEVLDIEQNTSGDLLNATLSDDGPELLTHSGDKIKPNDGEIVPDDVRNVLALADDFVASTRKAGEEYQPNSDSLNDRKIPLKPVFSQMCNDVIAKPTFTETNDATLAGSKADMTSDNLSISVTRNDILSGIASIGENQMQDTSAIADGKFRPNIIPPIADIDTSRLNLTDVALVSQNNIVDPKECRPNGNDGHRVLSSLSQKYPDMLEEKIDHNIKVNSKKRTTEVPGSSIQSSTKDQSSVPVETEVHEDIEGDNISLIKGEQTTEQVIDVIRELQPPRVQHYEKNIIEIRVGDGNNKDSNTRKGVLDNGAGSKILETEDTALRRNPGTVDVANALPQDSVADKIYTEYDTTDQKYLEAERIDQNFVNDSNKYVSERVEYRDDAEPKYELNPDHEHTPYGHEPGENNARNLDMHRNGSQISEQNPEQSYDPDVMKQLNYDARRPHDQPNRFNQPVVATDDVDQTYNANRQYETDSNQLYEESNSQFAYNSDPRFEDDLNRQYGAISNEQYGAGLNEHYKADPNVQYADDPNEQYEVDHNEHFTSDPNEQYSTDANERYMADPNERYMVDPNERYVPDPNEQYMFHPNEQYADPNEQYVTDPNEQYTDDPNVQYPAHINEQYTINSNEQYAVHPNAQYSNVSNEQYETNQNEGYIADPNEQYNYYQNQPYPENQIATDGNMGHEQYDYAADQNYQHDPNEQFEHDLDQQYERDARGQYEHDNEPSAQDPNQVYKEHEYGLSPNPEFVDYEEPREGGIQEFENELEHNYVEPDLAQSSHEDYPIAIPEEHSESRTAAADSHIRDLSEKNDNDTGEYSADGKMGKKDVIKALLESDTESTIERDPSNNTESDFNFN